jgi:hypothetical protein
MDQCEESFRESQSREFGFMTFQVKLTLASIYARIATGEAGTGGSKLGIMMRNPGFVLGRARRASETAREQLLALSADLAPNFEGFRFMVEFELAKLLAKRKERDEARVHAEKAIAFLQPMGDCQGMRDARAFLATLDQK